MTDTVSPDLVLPDDQGAGGRSFDARVMELLAEVIASGTLTATKGAVTPRFEQQFADLLGVRHAIACASGSAAVHAAVAALELEPGDEVITTAVTDMGALTPLLYQGLIPVFADVDRTTGNVTPETVSAVRSDRTRAVIVTHLFGNPADVGGIRSAMGEGVTVIEDAAQAFLASRGGQRVGTLGDVGCFSFQQGKHITAGEGGIVVTDDDGLAHEIRLFVNKSWPYGESQPDHRKLGLNYRTTELHSAVLLAQLPRLPEFVAHRRRLAEQLSAGLASVPGLVTPAPAPGAEHAYWRYPLVMDQAVVPDGVTRLARRLRSRGIPAAPRYIGKPAFRCGIFVDARTLGSSSWPLSLARPEARDYDAARFPGTFAFLESVLVLPWNEKFEEVHVELLLATIGEEVGRT